MPRDGVKAPQAFASLVFQKKPVISWMSASRFGPDSCQSMAASLDEWTSTLPLGKWYSVSGAHGTAAFDHDIQGCVAAPGLWKTVRCVRKSSSLPSECSTDHCVPNRNSRSPQVTYARCGVRAMAQSTGSFCVGECEMGKLTSMPPATKPNRGKMRVGRMTSGTYNTSLPDPLCTIDVTLPPRSGQITTLILSFSNATNRYFLGTGRSEVSE